MKTRYAVLALIAALAALSPSVMRAQQWVNFTDTHTAQALFELGGDIWVGTSGALVRYQTGIDKSTFFYRANSGLPSNVITAFLSDSARGTWIATWGGLAHFDGVNWQVYNTYNSPIPANDLTCLHRAADGAIWVGTYYNGLARFDGSHWTVYSAESSTLPDNNIYGITTDRKGHVWAGTKGKGVAEFDGTTWVGHSDDNGEISSNYVNDVLTDTSGKVWAATSKGVSVYDGTSWWTYDVTNSALPTNDIASLALDGQGHVWAATSSSGLAWFDGRNWTAITGDSGLPDVEVRRMMFGSDGSLWLATSGGLVHRTGSGWHVTSTQTVPFTSNSISALAGDSKGGLWFGSRYFGVAEMADQQWHLFTDANDVLPSTTVRGMLADYNGRIWVATSLGLSVHDNGTWTSYTAANSPLQIPVTCVALDSSGTVWVGTDGLGVKSFGDGNWLGFDQLHNKLPFDNITAVAVDKSNRVWVGTEHGCGYKQDSTWKTFTMSNSALPDDQVQAIAAAHNGDVYIGTANGGVARYNASGWTLLDSAHAGLPGNNVTSLLVDKYGQVWAGVSGGGIARLANDHWVVFATYNSALPDNNVQALALDHNGNIMIGMVDGGAALFNEQGVSSGVREASHAVAALGSVVHPNPVSSSATIAFTIEHASDVSIDLVAVDGRPCGTIFRGRLSEGEQSVRVDAGALPSGSYIYRIHAGGAISAGTFVVMR
ncbi:MAG: hypothetical protein JST22_08875 [Bacteroidetes bacterium]|nr:hypothetical protein [Bacteroidota bacterium]